MIEVKKLVKKFGDFKAVDNISFSIKKGETIGFLGPNGAGKTTTMRIITTFSPATYGTVEVGGYDIFKDAQIVRKKIGYLPERPPLYFDMRVEEYLDYIAQIKDISKKNKKNYIDEAIEKCGLTEMRSRIIGNLSKGYKQRVGIAQAIVNKPELLILDEPTSGLDPVQIKQIRTFITNLSKEYTIILSSHILHEVSITCSRVIIINKGKLIAEDSPADLEKLLHSKLKLILELKNTDNSLEKKITSEFKEITNYSQKEKNIILELNNDIRPELAAFLIKNNYEILSFKPEEMSLEDIFVKLIDENKES